MWTLAAGVGLQLMKHGHPVRVRHQWEFMFGTQARIRGDEPSEVTFLRRSVAASFAARNPSAELVGQNSSYAIFITQILRSLPAQPSTAPPPTSSHGRPPAMTGLQQWK